MSITNTNNKQINTVHTDASLLQKSWEDWKKTHSEEEIANMETYFILSNPKTHLIYEQIKNNAIVNNIDADIDKEMEILPLEVEQYIKNTLQRDNQVVVHLKITQKQFNSVINLVKEKYGFDFDDLLVCYLAKIVEQSGLPFEVRAYNIETSNIAIAAQDICWDSSLVKNGVRPDSDDKNIKEYKEKTDELANAVEKRKNDILDHLIQSSILYDFYINEYLYQCAEIILDYCGLNIDTAVNILVKHIYNTGDIGFNTKAYDDTLINEIVNYRKYLREAGVKVPENSWEKDAECL